MVFLLLGSLLSYIVKGLTILKYWEWNLSFQAQKLPSAFGNICVLKSDEAHVLIINNYSLLRRSIRYFVDLLNVFWLRWFPIVLHSTPPLLIVSLVNNFETSYIIFILGQHRKSPIQNRGSFKLLINLCRSWPMKMGVICFK